MKNNRKKFIKLIPDKNKRKLQMKYAAFIAVSYFLLAFLMVGLYHFGSEFLDRYFYSAKNSMSSGFSPVQWGILGGVFLIIFGYIAILSIFVINLSQRLIGPFCRIESVIKEALATGKVPVIKLRKNDDLQETADLLNKFFEDSRFKKSLNV